MRQPIWIWMLLLATPLVAGGGYLLSQRSSGGIEADQGPARPITVPVSRGNVDKTVTAPGRLVGLEEGYLSFPAGGRLRPSWCAPAARFAPGPRWPPWKPPPWKKRCGGRKSGWSRPAWPLKRPWALPRWRPPGMKPGSTAPGPRCRP